MLRRSVSSWMRQGCTLAFALSSLGSAALFAQVVAMPATPTVYNNPMLPDDPRVGLKAGFTDAASAISGMRLVMNLPKPPGFGVGTTPQELAPAAPRPTPVVAAGAAGAGGGRRQGAERITFGSDNSDLAFTGHYVLVGNYNGLNIYDVTNPEQTKLYTSVMCPGSQDDVSVYGHLVFLSVEPTAYRTDCGTQPIENPAGAGGRGGRGGRGAAGAAAPGAEAAAGPAGLVTLPAGATGAPAGGGGRGTPPPPNPDRFRGVRIFDITDISHPKQVAAVQTCRGSHTHTLVTSPKDKDNVYIYVSGTSQIRSAEELAGCSNGGEDDPTTANYSIAVIQVPLAHPELSKVVSSPRIFADEASGKIDGITVGPASSQAAAAAARAAAAAAAPPGTAAPGGGRGGFGGGGQGGPRAVGGCHDITAYPAIGLAAGACVSTGLLLDISDPVHPKRVAAISDPNFSFWHSASFNNEGTRVIFSDEYGGGSAPHCQTSDPMTWGGDSIFTLRGTTLTLDAYYKMPAPQTALENCTAHNGSMIPIPGRDILVQAYYQGGITVMDYTDPHHPFEIGYFDRGPLDAVKVALGGYWSSYWYNGYIYGSEISRGLDVFKLTPSKFVTQAEIDAADQVRFPELNVQSQPRIVYPKTFVTAKAYVDQLARSNAITAAQVTAMNTAMDKKNTKQLKAFAATLDKGATTASAQDAPRMLALAEIMKQ